VHPFLIAQLADDRRAQFCREAAAARRVSGIARPGLRQRCEAALTRLAARMYRPLAVPVCCPA
jgi:hypothetical protein